MNTVTEADVLQALSNVRDPDFNRNIVELKFVRNLKIDEGRVSFTIELATPTTSAKEAMRGLAHDPNREVRRAGYEAELKGWEKATAAVKVLPELCARAKKSPTALSARICCSG